jgi:hypothetical protein
MEGSSIICRAGTRETVHGRGGGSGIVFVLVTHSEDRMAPASLSIMVRLRACGSEHIYFRFQVKLWPAKLSLEAKGSRKPFEISVSTKMDARL